MSVKVDDRMKVEQFVMAYSVEQDRLRAILPEGFVSLRPVLRINAEIRDGVSGYLEFNTAVEHDGVRGWLNIGCWHDMPFSREGKTTVFQTDFLEISFTSVGIEGSCPAEKDNGGCFFIGKAPEAAAESRWMGEAAVRRLPEKIAANKEFCDCRFRWRFTDKGAFGESIGMTLPAYPTEVKKVYPKEPFTVEKAAEIACEQVLGAYVVRFERE